VFLRETRRTNRDGTVVSYLQLAHNRRHPVSGNPVAKVIHSFGRADQVDRAGLARLVASISRFLTPEQAVTAAGAAEFGGEVQVLDSRRLGAAWTLDRIWERLGIGAAIRRVAGGRRLDGEPVERVVFALICQRACEPGSKPAATGWVAERVAIAGCPGFSDDAAYAAMDFLLDALGEIAAEVFAAVAHLLNLDLDIVFVDTTSTYWETETADEEAELADEPGDDETSNPAEAGTRAFGHSKDHRPDLPQVVIAMAVTRDGVPVRCWSFPGDTADTAIIRTIKDDLGGWGLRRLVWVADRGFASATNRAYLTRGGGHYIHAEKLRHTNAEAAAALARPGRYRTVADNLRVKEVQLAPGGDGDGDQGARTQRFVICHKPGAGRARPAGSRQPRRPPAAADRRLRQLARTSPRRARRLAQDQARPAPLPAPHPDRLLRIDHAAIRRESHLDGKWLLRTCDLTLTPDDLAAADKQLLAVERGWRDMKSALGLRPIFHYREDRIRAHIQLCWLALLLLRVIENATSDTWRNARHELDRMHLVTLATHAGQIAQHTTSTAGQQTLLRALDLPEPPKIFDYTLPSST
jgi:hypothetical protein